MTYIFFYKGANLREYCEKNGLDANKIRNKVNRLMQKKEYENYTIEQLIDVVLNSEGMISKYMYKGKTLKKYCEENGYNYGSVLNKLKNLKNFEEYEGFSNDELILIALDSDIKKFKYRYQGVGLKKYCLDNNIDYSTIVGKIRKLKKDEMYKEYTDLQLVKEVLNSLGRGSKYIYKGKNLKVYCKENGLNYETILSRIKKMKSDEIYQSYEDSELIRVAIESFNRKSKYSYNGISLNKYCDEQGLSKGRVYSRIKSLSNKKEYQNLPIEEIIDMSIENEFRTNVKYIYDGMKLKDYCDKQGINFKTVLSRIRFLKKQEKNSDLSLKDLIEMAVNYDFLREKRIYKGVPLSEYCEKNGIDNKKIVARINSLKSNKEMADVSIEEIIELAFNDSLFKKYSYQGIPLEEYCEENSINLGTIKSRLIRLKKDKKNKDLNIDELVEMAIDYEDKRVKYEYNGIPLYLYCKENDISMNSLYFYIRNLKMKYEYKDCTNDELVELALLKYRNSKEKDIVFDKLNSKNLDEDEAKQICECLNVSYENAKKISMNMTLNKAIKIVWFFGDGFNGLGEKCITSKKLKELYLLANQAKESNLEDCYKFKFYDMYGLYKCNLYDTRDILCEMNRKNIEDIYKKAEINISALVNKKDALIRMEDYFLKLINNVNLNTSHMVRAYVNKSIKEGFSRKIKNILNTEKKAQFRK